MRIVPVGDTALSIEFDDGAPVAALHRAMLAAPIAGVVESVPGLRSLLVVFDPVRAEAAPMAEEIRRRAALCDANDPGEGRLWRLPVRYDGPDLAAVAEACGLVPDRVVELHSGARYRVRLLGFLPGFAYMGTLPPELRLPRRAEPRTKVPAGAVAIADDMTAVYPWDSPGGWHLLGRCETVLFDQTREPPALLAVGDRVEFVPR